MVDGQAVETAGETSIWWPTDWEGEEHEEIQGNFQMSALRAHIGRTTSCLLDVALLEGSSVGPVRAD